MIGSYAPSYLSCRNEDIKDFFMSVVSKVPGALKYILNLK
jgi:hypothetical protein